LARGCRRVAEVANEGLEETAVELLRRDDVRAAVRRGDIDHALVVAALYWLELLEDGGGAVRR
jgi:ABC-type taurine transport system substrate-binding protein